MNILIVTGIFPPDIGGPATYVPLIAEELVSRGHRVRVVTLSDELNHNDERYAFKLDRIPRGKPKPLRWIKAVFLLRKLGESADVLLVCGLGFEAALANLMIRKPLVMRIVGDLVWERSQTFGLSIQDFEEFQKVRQSGRISVLQILQKWWISRADVIIVPSDYLARWIAGTVGARKRIVRIRNVVQHGKIVDTYSLPLQTETNIITVGRLLPWKRVDGIIRAIAELQRVGLVVVGDGPEHASLEALALDLGVSDRVLFAGRQDRDNLQRLIKSCDVFVLNSTYEGLPFVLLEAMALGIAVVATPVGGVPEIIHDGKNGLLVDVSGAYLVETLRKVIRSKTLREHLCENARDFVQREFDWSRIMDETEALLLRTADRTANH